MKVVMISGWKGSGKDTAADFLMKKHKFKRVAFADPLKDIVANEWDIPRSWCDDREYKESAILKYPVDPKDEFGRMIAESMVREFRSGLNLKPFNYIYDEHKNFYGLVKDQDESILTVKLFWTPRALCILKGSTNRSVTSSYWISIAAKDMVKDPQGLYVISDVRYASEIVQVKDVVGKENVLTIRINRFDDSDSADASERDLDHHEFDRVIENKSTKEDLYRKMELALDLVRR